MDGIKSSISTFKNRLVNTGSEEPLSKLSLAVIIALDLFILFVVFEGLHDHTKQITSPNEYIPYECQEVFIRTSWSDANFLTKVQTIVLSDHNNYSYRYDTVLERAETEDMHSSCREFYTRVKLIAENQRLKDSFIDRQGLLKQKEGLTDSLNVSKDVYETSLLEKIADQDKNKNDLPAIKASIATHATRTEGIDQRLAVTEKLLNEDPLILELRAMVSPDNQNRQGMVNDFKEFQFSYPFKELCWQLVFMLPIFFIFYIWSSRSVKKDNRIQTLISTHLLAIASIPIILKVGEVVIDLIPRHFFKTIFKILTSLHIIAIWHYSVISVSVGAGLLAVYLIQKKLFNRQRIQQKRLMKGACYFCGKNLPQGADTCPFCGTKQLKKCTKCEEETYVCGSYCRNCGYELSSDLNV